ncbi:MAG: hypothetical protein HGB05_11455 [Chloroflexi bacterium]|nr:hypothetical protein [Chloroflexota bacterium]NTW01683.1 hypothetical protein [Oscillochloris sp.]
MATTLEPLTEAEVKQLIDDWYHGLDVHAPTVEMLPLVAEEGLEMRFPEATLHGQADFDRWYNGVIRIFFDEVHKLDELTIKLSDDRSQAEVRLVGLWEASRWRAPASNSERLRMRPNQTWQVRRSAQTGKPVIARYIVNSLDPLPGSVPL